MSPGKYEHKNMVTFLEGRLRKVHYDMLRRCYNKKCPDYHNYGGRGIRVSVEFQKFEDFLAWAKANGAEGRLWLERNDVNGDYSPSNCCFTTHRKQQNNKQATLYLTAFGETKSLGEWLLDERCLVKQKSTIRKRVQTGYSPEYAMTQLKRL